MKDSGAPSIGDIVQVAHAKCRLGIVVKERGIHVGIRYFKASGIRGTPVDFVWWIHRTHVEVISAA